jgi:threonine dehydratase
VHIVGCQPERSPVMARSAEAGRLVELESGPTLSDGTAGGIEPGAITFPLCQEVVDEYRLVDEQEIASAMRDFIDAEHQLLEGAAGVAIAAFRQVASAWRDRNVVILICGANISREDLRRIL